MKSAISTVFGMLGGVWLASLFYHNFFYVQDWTTVPVILTGLVIVAMGTFAGVFVGEWLEDNT